MKKWNNVLENLIKEIDEVKREIIDLYKDDFFKNDDTGLIGRMYDSVPMQLATDKRSYVISAATGKKDR